MSKSKIRDNHNHGKVGDFLIDNLKQGCKIDVVSAYFTIYAYYNLKEQLDEVESMRFLFGEPTFIKEVDPAQKKRRSYKIEYDREDEQLRIPMETRLTQKRIAQECYDFLSEKAEVKSMVKPNFLHGKMYHIKHSTGIEKAIAGSSNFTSSGLGFGGRKNIELNMIVDSDQDREDLTQWFENIWNESPDIIQDVKDEVLQYLSQLYDENSPEFIYYKTLFHVFRQFLDSQSDRDFEASQNLLDSQIWESLYEFQKIGVTGALNRIRRNGGCIIADSVGLGKTYEALAIIKEFEFRNKNVLVICPKKLSSNWTVFQASQNHALNPFQKDKFQYHVLYHTDMGRISGTSGAGAQSFETFNWGAYDLVVVDESHNFKGNPEYKTDKSDNQKLNRPAWLMERIIKQGANTKVLLLSATPVNTSLKDLRNQISLITHGNNHALSDTTGIIDIAQLLKVTQTQFTNWADVESNPNRKLNDFLEKIDSGFFKLLDELTIARSRDQIRDTYSEAEIGKFPERLAPTSVYSPIDTQNRFPAYDRINAQILEYKLSVFNPSKYIKDAPAIVKKYEERAKSEIAAFTQADRENFLIGMMKMNFLKRLESSIYSFGITLDRTIRKIENLQSKIDEFKKQRGTESDFEVDEDIPDDEEDEDYEDVNWQVGKKLKFDLGDLKLDEWLIDLENDRQSLLQLYNTAVAVDSKRDAKLAKLRELILKKHTAPINDGNMKFLIFTAFADTAVYIFSNLKAFAKENSISIALVTGDKTETTFGTNEFEHILTNFSPLSKKRNETEGQIDVLIATDCISEGQNLQDCDTVVNYDIHWNPVRIIQRFGRIDRLHSRNERIQLINFWPTDDLEQYINLKSRVEARMALGNLAATGDDDPLGNPELQIVVKEGELKFREKQLLRLKDEILDIEELDDSITLTDFSLEDFRMKLLSYIEENRDKLERSPLGMYAIVPNAADSNRDEFSETEKEIIKPGVIYCLKQKNESAEGERLNPVAPYFLIYIRHDGTVRYNYVNIKQILDIYHRLCHGIAEPYNQLCELFNSVTNNGEDMSDYADLIQKSIKEITAVHSKRSAGRLLFDRQAVIAPMENQVRDEESFELITWLVIK